MTKRKTSDDVVPTAVPMAEPVESAEIQPDIAREEQREQDPLKKEVWAKMGRIQERLRTLEVTGDRHREALKKIEWETSHLEAQFKCLRGFVTWEKAMNQSTGNEPDYFDPDHIDSTQRDDDLRKAQEKPQ